MSTWHITGEEITSNRRLTILYSGSEINKNYLTGLAFGNSYRESYLGEKWVWNIHRMARSKKYLSSLIMVEGQEDFLMVPDVRNSLYIPLWIHGEVDCSTGFSEFLKNDSLKSDARRIRKNKLDYEISKDESMFKEFYDTMYVPHITKAHGGAATIQSYEVMQKEFKYCELLRIIKEDEYIAGILLVFKDKKASMWSLGIRNGDHQYVKDGAIGALFYFSVFYLIKKGFDTIAFGLSRAFLNDGVVQYKMKWKQKIIGSSDRGMYLRALSDTPAVKGYFMNNPFIYKDNRCYCGAVFMDHEGPFTQKDLQKIFRKYFMQGIEKLRIYRLMGSGSTMENDDIPDELADRISIETADSFFKQ